MYRSEVGMCIEWAISNAAELLVSFRIYSLYYTNSMIIQTWFMATIRKTVTFTQQQDKWIKAQIEAGEYTNDSEYLRNLVRQDQARNAKFISFKSKLIDGLESGVGTKSLPEIMSEVEARMREDGRL